MLLPLEAVVALLARWKAALGSTGLSVWAGRSFTRLMSQQSSQAA